LREFGDFIETQPWNFQANAAVLQSLPV
jgi:hypothetical protein